MKDWGYICLFPAPSLHGPRRGMAVVRASILLSLLANRADAFTLRESTLVKTGMDLLGQHFLIRLLQSLSAPRDVNSPSDELKTEGALSPSKKTEKFFLLCAVLGTPKTFMSKKFFHKDSK